MKKFEFPLARVAKWSQQKLSLEQLALLRLVKEMADVDQRLQGLRKEITNGQADLQGRKVLAGHELQTLTRFVQRLAHERMQLHGRRQELAAKLEAQRQRAVAEQRKVKLFDNLQERRRQEWLQALSKEEEALASDLFLAKLARNSQQVRSITGSEI